MLAGGRSTRFGSDKALAPWQGTPLLVHALRAVASLGLTPRVITRDPWAYRAWARAFVLRERPGLGPAEGVRAALESLAAPWALVLAVDMPRVDGRLLALLLDEIAPPADTPLVRAVCFRDRTGRRHPLPGLYHRGVLGALEALPPGSSLQALFDAVPHRLLAPPGGGNRPDPEAALQNVNRVQDLERTANTGENRPSPRPESD